MWNERPGACVPGRSMVLGNRVLGNRAGRGRPTRGSERRSAATAAALPVRRRRAVGAEAVPAAALAGGVGVLDVEAPAHHVLDVIDLGAAQVRPAALVDHEAHALVLELAVAVEAAVVDRHAVLVAAAPAGLHEHADGRVLLAAAVQEFRRLGGAGRGEAHRAGVCRGFVRCVDLGALLHGTLIACVARRAGVARTRRARVHAAPAAVGSVPVPLLYFVLGRGDLGGGAEGARAARTFARVGVPTGTWPRMRSGV